MINVLASGSHGGFSFSEEFVEEVFKKFPPHTELGTILFKPVIHLNYVIDGYKKYIESKTVYDGGFHEVVEEIDFIDSYKDVKYMIKSKYGDYIYNIVVHTPSKKLYSREDTYLDSWRSKQEIVYFAQEFGLKKACGKHSKLYVTKVPDGYDYTIQEYDGIESVIISIPYDRIIQDLLDKINGKDNNIHPLTKKLIEGTDLREMKRLSHSD
jgi:hypothetical protein